jgi:membrane fusion protein (multidrug efflux system)
MLKTAIGSIVLVLCVLGSLLAIRYVKIEMMAAAALPAPEEFPEIVEFARPRPVILRQSTTTVGTILAPRSLQLKTEVVGTVSELGFEPGQTVAKGQLLLKLDTSVEEAQLASATAVEQIAQSTLERTRRASKVQAISELELEQASAIMSQAKADVLRLKAVIRKKTLRAPFDAQAGLFDIQVGQYLSEGTQITMLQGFDQIEPYIHIDFMMPQQAADDLHIGDEIRLAVDQQRIPAKIIAVDSQADRITRNVMARARLDHPPATMQPNDSVRIELDYGSSTSAVSIPASGLRRSPTGAFVYVVEPGAENPEQMRVRVQDVVPGRTIGQQVAIMSGLTTEQTIVSDGSFKLRPGLLVAKAASPAAPKSEATTQSDAVAP